MLPIRATAPGRHGRETHKCQTFSSDVGVRLGEQLGTGVGLKAQPSVRSHPCALFGLLLSLAQTCCSSGSINSGWQAGAGDWLLLPCEAAGAMEHLVLLPR